MGRLCVYYINRYDPGELEGMKISHQQSGVVSSVVRGDSSGTKVLAMYFSRGVLTVMGMVSSDLHGI